MEPFSAAKMLIMAAMETAWRPALEDLAHHFSRHARAAPPLPRASSRGNRRHSPANKWQLRQRSTNQRARQVALRLAISEATMLTLFQPS